MFTIFRRKIMDVKKKFPIILTMLCTGLLLMIAPLAGAAINTGTPSYDNLLQTELDNLMDQVSGQFEATGDYLDQVEFDAVLEKGLAEQGTIRTYYELALGAQELADANKDNPELQEKAKIAMDDLFLAVLNKIILYKELATTDVEITQALIDLLEGRGEGFTTEPQPFALDPLGGREPGPVIPPDEDQEVDEEVDDRAFTFLFYGRAYDLETDVDPEKSINGVLWFVEGPDEFFPDDEFDETNTFPPSIAPFFLWPEYNPEYRTPYHMPELTSPEVTKNDSFYRYTWSEMYQGDTPPDAIATGDTNTAAVRAMEQDIPPISASLYKNNWIAFVYGDFHDQSSSEEYRLDVWLDPGHEDKLFAPGAGEDRYWEYINLSDQTGEPLDYDEYLKINEYFYGENEFDLSDLFVVFRPDAHEGFEILDQGIGNRYTIEVGNPFMIVDRSHHHYDQGLSSLDQAIIHIADNPGTLNDDFRPGYWYDDYDLEQSGWDGMERWAGGRSDGYENNYPTENETGTEGQYIYGLQTVGQDLSYPHYDWYAYQYTPMYTQAKLEQSNFLAYVVQVEEDRVNEKILEMSDRADGRALIDGIRSYERIRQRDAFFAQNADAQAGRVMKDIHGNWVRVQQYILRPDSSTVQVLNVSLREAGGDLSGMSTIDFTTKFTNEIPEWQSLNQLPWGDYLNTGSEEGVKWIRNNSDYILASMSVEFKNPGNESVTESRFFYGRDETITTFQFISREVLSLQGNGAVVPDHENTFTPGDDGWYVPSYEYISHFVRGQSSGYYASDDHLYNIEDQYDEGEILIATADTKLLDVNFYFVGDDYSDHYKDGGLPSDGDVEFDEFDEFDEMTDIWAVLGTDESEGGAIEIVMNNPGGQGYNTPSGWLEMEDASGSLSKPIDTIFVPMSHMLWASIPDQPKSDPEP